MTLIIFILIIPLISSFIISKDNKLDKVSIVISTTFIYLILLLNKNVLDDTSNSYYPYILNDLFILVLFVISSLMTHSKLSLSLPKKVIDYKKATAQYFSWILGLLTVNFFFYYPSIDELFQFKGGEDQSPQHFIFGLISMVLYSIASLIKIKNFRLLKIVTIILILISFLSFSSFFGYVLADIVNKTACYNIFYKLNIGDYFCKYGLR